MRNKLLILNGPNLNLLGNRQPNIYGNTSYDDFFLELKQFAATLDIDIQLFQSNHEGELIDKIHNVTNEVQGIIINAGALTHYSYSLMDAILAINIPTVEVHISNIYKREEFRHKSVIAPVVIGQITGLGLFGYKVAIYFFADYLKI